MAVLGLNFTKIVLERISDFRGEVNIKTNVAMNDASSVDLEFGKEKQKVVKFGFTFTAEYQPNFAKIELNGDVVYQPKGDAKKLVDEWKKDKQLKSDVVNELFPVIIQRCQVESLILSREVGLPPPVPLPKVTPGGQ